MPDVQPTDWSAASSGTPSEPSVSEYMNELLSRLNSESAHSQLQLVNELAASGEAGLVALMGVLLDRRSAAIGLVEGKIYQVLAGSELPKVQTFLQTHFANGLLPLPSERSIDYRPLEALLVRQEFQAADRLTLQKMCELAGDLAMQRKWLYFTEVEQFPIGDLQTLDRLWQVYSEGKFGFSVQRELWLSLGKNWEKLWYQIGWKSSNSWTRYPQEFTWSIAAPKGHLPLSNQLRGVRVIAALMAHPAWTQR